jgi:chromosome segregation ATPase
MAAKSTSIGAGGARSAVAREANQLKKKVKELTFRLEREVKARKLDARLAAEAKKVRAQLTGQIKALRGQGQKLASELKSTLGNADERERMLKGALRRIADLKAELVRKTTDLRRKSAELKKLAAESAHRAAAILRSNRQTAAERTEASSSATPAPSEPTSTGKVEPN